MDKTVYTFSSGLVSTVAQLLQLAILTGTDLYDHLMTLQLVDDDGKLSVSPAYQEKLGAEILRLTQQAERISIEDSLNLEDR